MEYLIKNYELTVRIAKKGAELQSIRRNDKDIEYLWQGDPEFWKRRSPILFPFVGRLNEDYYVFDDVQYQSGQHGFARDMDFEVASQETDAIHFVLRSNDETLSKYPIKFSLHIFYQLLNDRLSVTYSVHNEDENVMYYSVGGHPAFNAPLKPGQLFEDYHVSFNPTLPVKRYKLNGPYLDLTLTEETQLADFKLDRELFNNDALIYELPKRVVLTLSDPEGENGVHFDTDSFPFVGIWTQYSVEAPFICFEPWLGIADTTDSNHQLVDKFMIQSLGPNGVQQLNYHIQPF